MSKSSPFFQDQEDFQRLRAVLEIAGYTDKGVMEALGVRDFPSMRGSDKLLLLHRTSHATPLDMLIRLFLMEVPVDIEPLRQAIEPMSLETWAEAAPHRERLYCAAGFLVVNAKSELARQLAFFGYPMSGVALGPSPS